LVSTVIALPTLISTPGAGVVSGNSPGHSVAISNNDRGFMPGRV
jgi:hypothetical protein